MGAGRVFAIDCIPSRLEMARSQNAEVIDFNREDPVATIKRSTGGIGVDKCIDAVGIDSMGPSSGPAAEQLTEQTIEQNERDVDEIAPDRNPRGGNWVPGDSPFQALEWAVKSLAKAGTLSIIGVYPETAQKFPIGMVMMKNLTVRAGNCNHRAYIPMLLELVRSGVMDPAKSLTRTEPLTAAIDAFKNFDERRPGWLKVELIPAA